MEAFSPITMREQLGPLAVPRPGSAVRAASALRPGTSATVKSRGAWWQQPGALSAVSVTGPLLSWHAVTALRWIEPLFLPPPAAVWGRLLRVSDEGFMDATRWQHAAASLGRVAVALAAALATAIPLGLWMGLSPRARAVLDPLIEFYRPVPPLA